MADVTVTSITQDMTRDEAELCLAAILGNLESARRHMLDMHQRKGWKALGYRNLADYFEQVYHVSYQEGYKRLLLHRVEENIQALSPISENVLLKSRWVQDSKIGQLEPPQQAEAYQLAQQIQQAERATALKGTHVVEAVAQIRAREAVLRSPYPVIAEMVAGGRITAVAGQEMMIALDHLRPAARQAVLELMATFGLTCPAVIGPLGSLFGRKTDNPSLMLPEVLTGFLGGVPLAQATLSDWQRAADEARHQHMADRLNSELPTVQPLIITVYKGDVLRTVAALKEALGDEVWKIRDKLMEE